MCGLVGIVGGNDVAAEIYDALTMLQHRGQDAAGIMTCYKGKFLQRKGRDSLRMCFVHSTCRVFWAPSVLDMFATRHKVVRGRRLPSRFM